MSLQFVVGPSGSGKTTYLYKTMLKRADEDPGRTYLILVPEQFNMQTQREICMMSPRGGIMQIDVQSFTRLAYRIFDEAGGNNLETLADDGKSMILRCVAARKRDELKVLAGRMDKPGYVNEIKSVISEFMQYDIYPEELDDMIFKSSDRPALASKLSDINILYQGFNDFLSQKYITSEEILDRAVDFSDKAPFLSGCEVYLDGYTGFTPVQIRFIGELLKRCSKVVVSVTLGSENCDNSVINDVCVSENDLFSMSKKTIKQLRNIAAELNITEDSPIICGSVGEKAVGRHADNIPLAYLERNLLRYTPDKDKEKILHINNEKGILLRRFSDFTAEARGIGREIYRLVHEKGMEYGDIAILSGSLEEYERFFSTELVKYGIPFFIDKKHDILQNPFVELLRAACDLILKDMCYDSVMRFMRNSVHEYDMSDVDLFDNYLLAAGIRRKRDYFKKWTYLPRGIDEEKLARINNMRDIFMQEIEPLLNGISPRKSVRCSDMICALYDYVARKDIYTRLLSLSADFLEAGDDVRSKEYGQIYSSVMSLFDRCVDLMGDELITAKELSSILDAGYAELSIGVLPPSENSVIIGDLERSRLSDVKVLFLAGCNDGKIPKDAHKSGILSELDRQILKEKDVELAPGTREQAFIQRFYLYMYLTKPSERLYLTYSCLGDDGKGIMPSYLVDEIKSLFNNIEKSSQEMWRDENEILTPLEGLDKLSETIGYDNEQASFIMAGLVSEGSYRDQLSMLMDSAFRQYREDPVSRAVAAAIFGPTVRGSVTRLEKFAQCAYAHFVKYGLNLLPKEEYSFDQRDLGNVYHASLKRFGDNLNKKKLEWLNMPMEEVYRQMDIAVDEVMLEMKDTALFASSRDSYNEARIRSVMHKTGEILTYQLQKGKFSPVGYEIPIEEYSSLDGISFADGTKAKLRLRGSIDRMDECVNDDQVFVRVIDYKSSENKLDLAAVYAGTSLQLIVYVNNAIELSKAKYPDKIVRPAGVLYYHIDDPVILESRELSDAEIDAQIKKELMLKGYVDDDLEIIARMDKDLAQAVSVNSDIIAVEYTKSGELSKKSKVLSSKDFDVLCKFVRKKIRNMSSEILSGQISPRPYAKGDGSTRITGCDYCSYSAICGFDENVQGYEYNKLTSDNIEDIIVSMDEIASMDTISSMGEEV